LYPESLVAQGRISSGGLVERILRKIDQVVLQSASQVVVPGRAMRDSLIYSRSLNPNRIRFVPNWTQPSDAHASPIAGDPASSEPDGEYHLLYAGNIGRASGVCEFAIQIGDWLEESNWRFVIAGSGSDTERLRKLVQERGWKRTSIHSPWEPEETEQLFSRTDVCLLPTLGAQALASIPSKLLSYWGHGRFVLAIADPRSDIAQDISASGGGICLAPGNYSQLTEALATLASSTRAELRTRGQHGAQFAASKFASEQWLPYLYDLICAAAMESD
jgi:glycosyltransferase involved in cell wall biosynthesis